MNKLGFSLDIEDWYHIPPISGEPESIYKNSKEFLSQWRSSYDYITIPTMEILDILDQYEIITTIFIVNNILENYPELIQEIKKRKHEIGCHGLYHESKLNPITKRAIFNKSEFINRTILSKKQLEHHFNTSVVGYRAPNSYISGWMIDALEEMGFEYDSSVSVNSLYNKTDSRLDGVSTTPYFPEIGQLNIGKFRRNIVEIPFSFYNILGCRIPTNGGPMLRFFGPQIIKNGIIQSLKKGPTSFYFHSIDVCSKSFPYLSFSNRLFWLIKGEKVKKYIINIIKYMKKMNVDMVPLRNIARDLLKEDGCS